MSAKKASAFSVYKQLKQLQPEEKEGVSVGRSGSGDDGVVREGVGSRGEERGDGKRKRKIKLKELAKKRRKMVLDDTQVDMETKEKSKPTGKTKKVMGKKKAVKEKIAKRRKNIPKHSVKGSPVLSDKKKEAESKAEESVEAGSSEEEEEAEIETPQLTPHSLEVQSVDGGNMEVPFSYQFNLDAHPDSRDAGRELFRLLINPFPVDRFFEEIWEQRPLFLSRHKPQYNRNWFSTDDLDHYLKDRYLEYSVNIDITSYERGEKLTHNPEGRAMPQVVWDYFEEGCSIRFLNPQTFDWGMWSLTSTLQEFFQSFVGSNAYLTPAGTQGFAPHADDIEAFVMQLEGKKRWKLYSPRESSEVLPRFSSSNLSQEELGEPILDVVLEPGDLLYFPRGTFHQAESLPDVHSLHITLSTYQKYTWGDTVAKLMSGALDKALREDISFRRGLPLGCLNYTGSHTSDRDDPRRQEFMAKMEEYLQKLFQDHAAGLVDEIMDRVAADNVHSSQPPCLTRAELAHSVEEKGSKWGGDLIDEKLEVVSSLDFSAETEVKMTRYNAIRLVTDSDGHMLYYNQQNTRVYQEKDPQGIPLTSADVRLVEKLMASYPAYIKIVDLVGREDVTDEIELLYTLFSHAIILIK